MTDDPTEPTQPSERADTVEETGPTSGGSWSSAEPRSINLEPLRAEARAARAAGDGRAEADALYRLAVALRGAGRRREARGHLERALKLRRAQNDLTGAAEVMTLLGTTTPRESRGLGVKEIAVILVLAVLLVGLVAGGTYGAIRLVRLIQGETSETAPPSPIQVEPQEPEGPVPAETVGETPFPGVSGTIRLRATKCTLQSTDTVSEGRIKYRLTASRPHSSVVVRGTLLDQDGRELGTGTDILSEVQAGEVYRRTLTFTISEELPEGELTCRVDLDTVV